MAETNPFMDSTSPGIPATEANPFMDSTPASTPSTWDKVQEYAPFVEYPAAVAAMGLLGRLLSRGRAKLPPAELGPRAPLGPQAEILGPRAPIPAEPSYIPPQLNPPPISVTPQGTAILPGTAPEAIQRAQKIEALGRAMQDPSYPIKYFAGAPLALQTAPESEQDFFNPGGMTVSELIDKLKNKASDVLGHSDIKGAQMLNRFLEMGAPLDEPIFGETEASKREREMREQAMGMAFPGAMKSVTSLAEAQAPGLIKKGYEAFKQVTKRAFTPKFSEYPEVFAAHKTAVGETTLGLREAPRMASTMANFTPQEKILAGEALRGAPEPMAIPKIAEAVKPMRQEIDRLSSEISQQLDPLQHKALLDEIQSNMGTYVRRVYGRDVLGKDYTPPQHAVDSARKWLKANLSDASESNVESTILEIIAGKARSLNTVGSGIGKLRNLPERAPGAGLPKATRIDISPLLPRERIPQPIRELMGEVIPGDYVGARTVGDLSSTLANLKFFKTIASNPNLASDMKQVGWSQMPQGARLGALSGKYVPEALYDDLQEIASPEVQNTIDKVYHTIYNAWRMGKTAMDPVTHGRNVLGNVLFSGLAKVSPFDPRNGTYYKQAFSHIYNDTPMLQEAYKQGVIGTEMMGADIKPLIKNLMATRGDNFLVDFWDAAKGMVRGAGELYKIEDQIPKLASYIKQLSLGMSPPDAAKFVDRWFPNYTQLPRIFGKLKKSKLEPLMSPFVSFTAEATRIFKNAAMDPSRWGTLAFWGVGLPAGITAYSAAHNGISVEELKDMFMSLPKTEQTKGPFNILLPWRDKKGGLQVVDISPIIPLGQAFQQKSLLSAIGAEEVPLVGSLVGGNPFVMAVVQSAMDQNWWTEAPITRPSDKSKTLSHLEFLAGQTAPIPTSLQRVYREYEKGRASPTEQTLEAISPVRTSSVPNLIMRRYSQSEKEAQDIEKDINRVAREGSSEINPFLDRRATPREKLSAAARMDRLEKQGKEWEKRNKQLERAYYRSGGR